MQVQVEGTDATFTTARVTIAAGSITIRANATATAPADNGSNGWTGRNKLWYSYGGTGGASTHGTATGGGLVQSSGGVGGYGCGSGGMGGALTGSAAGIVSRGGLGYCLIICW